MSVKWRKAIGLLLIIGAVLEFIRTFINYMNGTYVNWPAGSEIGFAILVIAGVFLYRTQKKS